MFCIDAMWGYVRACNRMKLTYTMLAVSMCFFAQWYTALFLSTVEYMVHCCRDLGMHTAVVNKGLFECMYSVHSYSGLMLAKYLAETGV